MGLTGKDYVILAADMGEARAACCAASVLVCGDSRVEVHSPPRGSVPLLLVCCAGQPRSIVMMKDDEDKILDVDGKKIMATAG